MFKKKNDGNGEKIFRYSIRKYHFGDASVAVAALMFFANGVQAQAPAVSSATASDVVAGSAGTPDEDKQDSDGEEPEKVSQTEPSAELKSTGESNSPETKIEDASKGQETAGLAPTKPETKPAAQETSQGGAVKEQDQPTSATKTTEAKSLQGNLQALLEKLTLSSMKALHDEVEAGLAAAKAVLDDPNATQAQVDEQVRAMEELTSRVNQALEPSLPKLTDLGEAGSENNKLVEPNGTATEQASSGKRRKRGGVTEPGTVANQVNPTDGGKETAPGDNSQSTPRELPTYTNTTKGENGVYGLKKELEDITKELRRYGASEDKIQAAKAAADKFNEAFSKGDTISQEDFAAALVDLKKSRDLIEGVLEEKYGEETTAEGVTPQPRDGGYSDFRSANYSGRSARAANPLDRKESYIEDGKSGDKTYDRYTYVFYSNKIWYDNSTKKVSEAKTYILAKVTPTQDGFRWELQINNGHRQIPGTGVWLTIPSGQEYKQGSDSISITRKGGGTTAVSSNAGDLLSLLKHSATGFSNQTKGTVLNTGIDRRRSPKNLPVANFDDLARHGVGNIQPYQRQGEPQEMQNQSNEKFHKINNSGSDLYYFSLGNSDNSYKITFETRGNNDIKKLDYAVGLRGNSGNWTFLVNQWHSRTYNETKDDAKDEIERAKQRKNESLGKNGNLSSVEQNSATAKVNTYAREAIREIENANNLIGVEDALHRGLENINGVNPVGKENAIASLENTANTKKASFDTVPHLTTEEKKAAIKKVDDALAEAKRKVNEATDQAGVEKAKNDGIGEINKVSATATTNSTANQGNSSTPGNGGNQAGSDSRGDTGNQGDRPAPSGDGSQGDANNQDQPTTPSTPAHSGDSTDQAASQSTQQRGTGNATEVESPQGLSGSSVTAPARSRRSVSFAGGSQSSQEKQVDKSVLRDLIQDLETRLKDLDGIDQSVIDAAKIILGEGQEALRNADLTEAGLKEMTAKVKEALESLKGKQTTKDEETKETSKEQGHLPYGTMIGSLLALLGLLLFLIARRKKESELKKLTKELTKVLQESDLTNVDAKVLDQAREALAQAVAFLANEKESDHTEDELIEKLKTILTQLR